MSANSDESENESVDNPALLRRIHPEQVISEGEGGWRPSSAAFKDPNLSVDAEPILHANGLDWHFCLNSYDQHSLVRFPAIAAKEKGLEVVYKPLHENPAHTEVIGKKTSSIANHLVRASEWVCLRLRGGNG